jgi:hypothetical protein
MLRSSLVVLLLLPALLRADAFDNYTNPILGKVPDHKLALPVKKLTTEMLVEHGRALPGATAAMVVVRTNDGKFAKLLVRPAAQKISADEVVPILMIERFVTFREGEERTIAASGHDVRLFADFQMSLDIGQVVPAKVGGDLRCTLKDGELTLEPIGKAEMFVVTKHLPEANPKKGPKVVVGEKFEPEYFNGKFKLYDDGRRSGILVLKVIDNGDVDGFYYSDKDGAKYEVSGKIGNPKHQIEFTVTFPRTAQYFRGMLFTGDGRAMAGVSRLQDRETGFYAVRIEE